MNATEALILGLVDQVKSGTALIAGCIAETLKETDPTFQERFLEKLGRAYEKRKYGGVDVTHELEMLLWVREMLTGQSWGAKGKPFLQA